jgi:hypothetical protein
MRGNSQVRFSGGGRRCKALLLPDHLWGGFAIFHWKCFGEYLRAESEEQVENAVWKASSNN